MSDNLKKKTASDQVSGSKVRLRTGLILYLNHAARASKQVGAGLAGITNRGEKEREISSDCAGGRCLEQPSDILDTCSGLRPARLGDSGAATNRPRSRSHGGSAQDCLSQSKVSARGVLIDHLTRQQVLCLVA